MRRHFMIVAVFLLICAVTRPVLAQNGTIYGKVTDGPGKPLPSATVVAINQAISLSVSTLTDDQGLFAFSVVPGVYVLTVSLNGFEAQTRRGVTVSRSDRVTLGPIWLSPIPPLTDVPQGTARIAEEWNLREAVFRYQFAQAMPWEAQRASAYCLSTPGTSEARLTDPPASFVARFDGMTPSVKSRSACSNTHDGGGIAGFDKQTGGPEFLFTAGTARWISSSEAEVPGFNGPKGTCNLYRLNRVDGVWQVVKDTVDCIF